MVKFTNKPKGRTSKRVALNMKYKLEKKVKQHHKKLRKEARKMTALGMVKKSMTLNIIFIENNKDPGIPNLYPFKKNILE